MRRYLTDDEKVEILKKHITENPASVKMFMAKAISMQNNAFREDWADMKFNVACRVLSETGLCNTECVNCALAAAHLKANDEIRDGARVCDYSQAKSKRIPKSNEPGIVEYKLVRTFTYSNGSKVETTYILNSIDDSDFNRMVKDNGNM